MLRSITQSFIDDLISQARNEPRKRKIFRLHEHYEPVQRMVNALISGTYVTPHKHENPDKVELFCILKGVVAILQFDDVGKVEAVVRLDANGHDKVVDIPPRTYHTIIPLEDSAVLEIIQGPYDALTHKQFATWAPQENDNNAQAYLASLTSIAKKWK